MNAPIGKCSLCGGWVGTDYHATTQTPYCYDCGAIPKVPIIEMERPPQVTPLSPKEDVRGRRGKYGRWGD